MAAECQGIAVPVDMEDTRTIGRAADIAQQRMGAPVHAMVNSAAIFAPHKAAAITGANLNVDAGALSTKAWTIHGGAPASRPRKT